MQEDLAAVIEAAVTEKLEKYRPNATLRVRAPMRSSIRSHRYCYFFGLMCRMG